MPLQYSFWIIGETTLAIRCAEVLRDRAHDVRGLITAHPVAAGWARERSIDVIPFRDALPALSRTPYDFLLSIVNSRILGPDILSTPTVGAINYHDGPLPRYAGMHSTSWAILNEETEHGITWHGVAELVDAGPIFKQRMVPIDPDETALSLNAKAYEAALDAFVELVDDIGDGRLAGREQDLSERTYFPRLARPPAAGLLDWERPASAVSAVVRALDFGSAYPNPLGRAKVRCGSDIYLCNRLRVTTQAASAAPGTVVALGAAGITVAAADREVVIESVATLDGRELGLEDVIRRKRLAVGHPLAPAAPAALAKLTERNNELAAHEAHWLRSLRRIQAPEVPYRTAGSVPTGRYHRAQVPRPVSEGAADGATDGADSRAAELVAAFAALVSRLSAEGSVHLALEHPALRARPDEHPSLFASTVPVELEAHHTGSFAQHVTAVREALADAVSRETYALDLPARYPDLGRAPALPILVRIDPVGEPGDESIAELILDIGTGGTAEIRGDAGVMSATDVVRLSEQLATLLAAIAADPGIRLGAAPIVPERERLRLVSEWNATASPYPKQMTVHELFAERARSIPDGPAVISDGTVLTFGELDARADCWARVLQSHGIGRDAIVGLRTGRTPELVVGMLAILKAGGAYLPLDRSLPSARTQFMLDDARVKVVLTTRALRDDFEAGPRTLLCIDETPEAGPQATITPAPDPESLAYVIYTSGSTGTPKGVLVHHQGAVNYLWWAIRHYRASEGSGSPVHSPVAFDLTVTSLIAPLLAGRPVHLLDEGLGVNALADALRTGRDFTLVKLTPSHLDLLRHQLAPDETAGRARAFVIGGENLQGAGLAFWQRHAPDTRLINEYGPTETVVGCCIYDVPADQAIRGSVPIGRPIANTRLYVLDPGMQLLPIGIAGELYIGGDGVARGYLNRPELTAERFVPDPFDPSGGRLYRTGDRVRYLPDGNLEFLGRLDGQVKVRGYRIELGEIESALASHPAVSEAAATLWQDPVAGPRLVGYVTLAGTAPSGEELREWCARFLPDYMIPASFEHLDRLPLTGNGKVDRGALPMPAARRTALVEPRTELERRLTAIWSEVLGVPVGITDNFFELGGHSLLAVQMIARVREVTGQAPPLSVLLTRPTVEHVAAALAGDEPSEADPMMVCIAKGDSTPLFFLHGDFASGGFYVQTIARHLDAGQPMYSIRPPHPGGPATIEGMAALTLELIRSVQPTGPYLLGGNCNGGAVAFEIARLLRARGDEVRLLALVNTAHRNAHFEPVRRIADLVARAGGMDARRARAFYLRLRESVLRTMEHRPYGRINRSEIERMLWWAGTLGATMARVLRRLAATVIRRLKGLPPVVEAEQVRPIRDDLGLPVADSDNERLARYRYIDEAMREYLARPLDVPVTLIWWEQSGALDADPELHGDDVTRGFGALVPSVRVITLEGLHDMVPGRDIDALGRALAECAREAQPGAAPALHADLP